MDPSDIVFLVFAFVSSILVLIPLPWHLQSWNVGTCLLVIYIAMGCLIRAVDRIVWANNVNYVIPVWCDITTRVIVGLSVGIPAAALCLTRRIYIILGDPWSCSKPGGKRKALVTDLCIGLGCPILSVVFYYIVQGHRYNVFRDYGCTPAAANTLASYFLLWMWPPIIGLVTFVYSGLMIRLFIIRRKQTEESINSNPVLTMHRYIRFVALGVAQAILTLPPSIWVIVENVRCECLIPWVSWSNIKWGFSAVWRFDEVIEVLPPSMRHTQNFTDWLLVISGLTFFLFFGFAEEARATYTGALGTLAKWLNIDFHASSGRPEKTAISFKPGSKHDSVDSSSTDLDFSSPDLENQPDRNLTRSPFREGSWLDREGSIKSSRRVESPTVVMVSITQSMVVDP